MFTILNICWNVINRRKLIDEEATIDVTLQPLPSPDWRTEVDLLADVSV